MPKIATPTKPMSTNLLTPTAVAQTLGLPADTVRGWVRRGLVASVRFGDGGTRIGLEPRVIDQLRREA